MIATKKSLPRRTFLRGAGAMIGLPLLDSMVPAFSATRDTASHTSPQRNDLGSAQQVHRSKRGTQHPLGRGMQRSQRLSVAATAAERRLQF